MAIKVVIQMKASLGTQGSPDARTAGFSESCWFPGDDVAQIISALTLGVGGGLGLLPARAALLPDQASITGIRLYKGGAGKGQAFKLPYPGSSGVQTDIPQMALQCSTFSTGTGCARRWLVHCIPDTYVQLGIFAPSTGYITKINQYFTALEPFGFYSLPATPVRSAIINSVQNAVVPPDTWPTATHNCQDVTGFNRGDGVTIQGVLTADGRTLTITSSIVSVNVGANQIVTPNWNIGNTRGGRITQNFHVLSNFYAVNSRYGSISTRKVGNPPDRYRGRRSKRRKTAQVA